MEPLRELYGAGRFRASGWGVGNPQAKSFVLLAIRTSSERRSLVSTSIRKILCTTNSC